MPKQQQLGQEARTVATKSFSQARVHTSTYIVSVSMSVHVYVYMNSQTCQ